MKKSLLYFLAFMLCLLVAKPVMAKAADQNSNAVTAAVIFDSKWPNIDELRSAGVSNKSDYHLLTTVAVSVPPTLTTSGGNTSFVSGDNTASTPVAVDAGITVADVSRATLASATVAITGNFVSGGDVLSFINNGSTMGNITASSFDNVAGMFTLTSLGATATLAQWQSALQSITYTNTAVSPNTAARTISFIVDDGIATSNTATKTVAITATNQTPVLTTTSSTINYVVGATAVSIGGSFTISDPDNTTQTFGRVSIISGFNTGDVLAFTNTNSLLYGNITEASYTGTGALTLISSGATATNAQWANALSAVTFSSTSTPVGNRTISFTVNSAGKTSVAVTDVVAVSVPPTITLAPTTLPTVAQGLPYNQTVTASGGTAPYHYTVPPGTLPPGLSLNATTGAITGTSTTNGTYNFTITATDAGSFTGSRAYTVDVRPTITLSALLDGTVGTNYGQTITVGGGIAPYTFAVTAGALPAGLTLTGNSILGTPTEGGTFNFTITATDNSGGLGPYSGSRAYTVTFAAPTIIINPFSLLSANPVVPYNQTFTSFNGTAPYTYTLTAGALPAGLTLASNGTISGNATVVGPSFTFSITSTDSSTGTGAPYTKTLTYTISSTGPVPTISPASLVSGIKAGVPYSQVFTASGSLNTPPYTFARTGGGSLPPGLTLASDGTLSGTPTAVGRFIFQIRAADSSPGPGPYSRSNLYSGFTVIAPTIVVGPATVPDGTAGVAYSQNITATGGTAPYTYTIISGTLPAGVTLAADGTLSGTTPVTGTFTFTVNATDVTTGAGAPYGGSGSISVTFVAPTITLTTTLSAPTLGVAYSQNVSASGGAAPYTYAVTAGALPAGLALSASTGAISGTPITAGTFNFTVSATDVNSFTGSQAYVFTVGKFNQTITFADITATYGDAPVTLTGTSSSGLPVTYTSSDPSVATVSGNMLTILAAGTATITASQAGNANYDVATDVPKILTVNRKAIAITAAAQTKLYGTTDPALTYQVTSGTLVGTDAFTGALTRDAGEAVNTYAIKQGSLTSGNNYNLTYTDADLTITPAALTATANDQTRAYGAADPAFTVSYAGFVNGDTEANLTTMPTVSTTATISSAAGTYPLTIAGAVSPNYNITYVGGTLTITKPVLTVNADNKSRNYGAANPEFSVTYSGFINGDDASKITTAPVAVNSSTATTAPGNYPITVSGGASADYTFNYVPGVLTIVPLTNANLISLTTSPGSLSPIFDPGTFTYNVQVDNTTADLRLTATFDTTASATANGIAIPNGSPSSGVSLNVGNNVITLIVTAQDGVTKETYTLNVYRGIAPTSITANNILTPNGDGKNDFWVVKDIQLYPNNHVTVYDSAGRPVFTKRGYNNDWGGTLNETGTPLVGGTYFYIVDLGIGENVIKGFISIIRSR